MAKVGRQLKTDEQRAFEKALAKKIRSHVPNGKMQTLADSVGISYTMMEKYLAGVSSLGVYRLLQISRALGKDVGYWTSGLEW